MELKKYGFYLPTGRVCYDIGVNRIYFLFNNEVFNPEDVLKFMKTEVVQKKGKYLISLMSSHIFKVGDEVMVHGDIYTIKELLFDVDNNECVCILNEFAEVIEDEYTVKTKEKVHQIMESRCKSSKELKEKYEAIYVCNEPSKAKWWKVW